MKRFLSLAFFSSIFIVNTLKGFSSEFYEPFELKAFNRPISYLIDESIECYHGVGNQNGVLSLNFQNNKGMIALIDVSKGYKINIIREKTIVGTEESKQQHKEFLGVFMAKFKDFFASSNPHGEIVFTLEEDRILFKLNEEKGKHSVMYSLIFGKSEKILTGSEEKISYNFRLTVAASSDNTTKEFKDLKSYFNYLGTKSTDVDSDQKNRLGLYAFFKMSKDMFDMDSQLPAM